MTDAVQHLWTLKLTNHRGVTLGFLFESEASCRRYYNPIDEAIRGNTALAERGLDAMPLEAIQIEDSYSNVATLRIDQIAWVWITHLERELEGQKEVSLLQAHAQANMQRRAAADPLLRNAAPPSSIVMPPRMDS